MKYLKILISLMLFVAVTGCNDWLDVNENPNKLSELEDSKAAIPVAQVGLANTLMGWDLGFGGGIWSQYWTQRHDYAQFEFIDNYDNADFSDAYTSLYASVLMDCEKVKDASEMISAEYFIAEAVSIYTWQITTDLWGDVPYFEALKGEDGLLSPKFDMQESIYTDLIRRVDNLINDDYSSIGDLPYNYDFIYNGDMQLWEEFARTLKLKLMLRLSETSKYNNDDLLKLIAQGGFITNTAKISGSIWASGKENSKMHPMVEFNALGAGYLDKNIIASKTFIRWLANVNDPRIDKYFVAPNVFQVGSFQGDYASRGDADGDGVIDNEERFSKVEFASDSDIPLISTWELNFYIAEVYLRAGNDAMAEIYYNMAVDYSCNYWGVTNTLTGAGGSAIWIAGGTYEEHLEQIAIQKWTSYCKLQHIEAFFERNRLKYPALNMIDIEADRLNAWFNFPAGNFTLSVAGRNKLNERLPASPLYPDNTLGRNSNAPSQKGNIAEPVWWNQKTENIIQP